MKKYIIAALAAFTLIGVAYAGAKCLLCKGSGWRGDHRCAVCGGDGEVGN